MTSPFGDSLRSPGFVGPTGMRALLGEGSVLRETTALTRRVRADRRRSASRPMAGPHRRAAIDPVLLVPGFMAGDYTLRGMAHVLRSEGFRTYRSGIQVNIGCARASSELLERRLEIIAHRRGRAVTIVGHSLGGMLARSLAAKRPDLIDGIITMGSPVLAPAAVHPVLAWNADLLTRLSRAGFGGLMEEDCIAGACAQQARTDVSAPLPPGFRFTAIYSRRDGIADWRACLDPAARQIEVTSSHVGLAVDPIVIDHVLRTLRGWRVSRASRTAAPSEPEAAPRAVRR